MNQKIIKLIVIIVTSFILIIILSANIQADNPDLDILISFSYDDELMLGPGNTIQLMLVDQLADQQKNTVIAIKASRLNDESITEVGLEVESADIDINNEYLLLAVIKSENEMPVLLGSMKLPGYHLIIESQVDLSLYRPVDNFKAFHTGEENVVVNFLDKLAQFIYDGKSHFLPYLASNGEEIYGDNEFIIWKIDDELIVNYGVDQFTAYQQRFEDLDPDTFAFTGRGQEPGWLIDLNEDQLILEFDYAMNQLIIDRDYIQVERDEDIIIYSLMSSFFDLEIRLINERHFDIMSGELYLYTLEIESDKHSQNGGAIRIIRKNI